MLAVARPRNRWRFGPWRERLRADLGAVRSWVDAGPVDVYLVGGLGMAAHANAFYRNHGDIDLAVFTEDLDPFADYAASAGFRWAHAVAGVAVSPWHRVDLAVPISRPRADRPLRLIRGDRRWMRTPSRAEFVDVMLLERQVAGVAMVGLSACVPWRDFLPAVTVADSRRLWLPNPRHKLHLPARWPRQRRDLRAAQRVSPQAPVPT
jgi:hypothetical protein